jgi:hypothetical protein
VTHVNKDGVDAELAEGRASPPHPQIDNKEENKTENVTRSGHDEHKRKRPQVLDNGDHAPVSTRRTTKRNKTLYFKKNKIWREDDVLRKAGEPRAEGGQESALEKKERKKRRKERKTHKQTTHLEREMQKQFDWAGFAKTNKQSAAVDSQIADEHTGQTAQQALGIVRKSLIHLFTKDVNNKRQRNTKQNKKKSRQKKNLVCFSSDVDKGDLVAPTDFKLDNPTFNPKRAFFKCVINMKGFKD